MVYKCKCTFIRQLLQCQWARTQQNLQNECMVKIDQTAWIRRLIGISSLLFIGMPTVFMQLILQTCSWLKSNKFGHLGDGNQYYPEMEVDLCANFRLYRHTLPHI